MLLRVALCCCSWLVANDAAACFSVWSARDQLVYQSEAPPVDMSRPIHETLPHVFPGGHMVFDVASRCAVLPSVAPARTPAAVTALPAPGQVVRVLAPAGEPGRVARMAEVPTAALLAQADTTGSAPGSN